MSINAAEYGPENAGNFREVQALSGIPHLSPQAQQILTTRYGILPEDSRRVAEGKRKLFLKDLDHAWQHLDDTHPDLYAYLRNKFIVHTDTVSQPPIKQMIAQVYLAMTIQKAIDAGIPLRPDTPLPTLSRRSFFPQVDFDNRDQARLFEHAQAAAVHHIQDVSNASWDPLKNAIGTYMHQTRPYLHSMLHDTLSDLYKKRSALQAAHKPPEQIARIDKLIKDMTDATMYVFVALQDEHTIFERARASGDRLPEVARRRRIHIDQQVIQQLQPPSPSVTVPESSLLRAAMEHFEALRPSFAQQPGSSIRDNTETTPSQDIRQAAIVLGTATTAIIVSLKTFLLAGGDPQIASGILSNVTNGGPIGFLSSLHDLSEISITQAGAFLAGIPAALEFVVKPVVKHVIRPLLYPESR